MTKARDLADFLGNNTSLNTINNAYAAGTLIPTVTTINPNMVINGAMEINQRGDATGITTGTRTLDRHVLQYDAMGTASVTQDTDVPSGQGFSKSMKIQCTATAELNTGSSSMIFIHRLEGFDSVQTMYGTSDAKDVTLSFWIKANRTQTLTVNFENEQTSGGNPDQGYQTSQAYTTANTWQKMVITIAGDTRSGMGFNFNSSKALCFDISLSTGYTSSDTPSATWSQLANGQRHGHNTEYFADSTSNYFNITGIKLELGSEATDFQHVPYGEELAKCQRYYEERPVEMEYTNDTNATNIYRTFTIPVEKRATPSIAVVNQLRYWLGGSPSNLNLGSNVGLVATNQKWELAAYSLTGARGLFSGGIISLDAEI